MEVNVVCDFGHLDEGLLVPPRKRLLAGFKKQNSSDQSSGLTSASPPSTGTGAEAEAEAEAGIFVKNLLGSFKSGCSLEEIAESSNKTALAASEIAEMARTVAEEKAAIAARAIAAARTALDLVATFYDETPGRSGRDRHSKKNKSKRKVTEDSLFKEHEVENDITDDEQISQVIYRRPGLSQRSSSSSDIKSLKHKHPRILSVCEKTKILDGGIFQRDSRAIFKGDGTLDTEGTSREVSPLEKGRGSSLTKLISSSWRMDKDIVCQKRKARKQLIRMAERKVELS